MQLGYVGINYKNTDLSVRDKITFTDSGIADFMQQAEEAGVNQCMCLSTCNRCEVFYLYEDETFVQVMSDLFNDYFGLTDTKLAGVKCGEEALVYLFCIAAGLESMVLGEDQILGQLKDAADLSRTLGHSGKELNYIVREAVSCAKRIKTEYKVSEKPVSVCYVGIQELDRVCGISGKHALVIGSGKTAALAIRYLAEYGADVTVCSRTYQHAKALLKEFPDIQVIAYDKKTEALKSSDIVVSATSSPHLVIRASELSDGKKMTLLDLAAPRDIEKSAGSLDGVTLIDLDRIGGIVKSNQNERAHLLKESQCVIDEYIAETKKWLTSSRMDTTIQSLGKRCDEIVQDSYDYLNRKIDLSDHDRVILKKILKSSLHRLLKEPIEELKNVEENEQQQYKDMVEFQFGLFNNADYTMINSIGDAVRMLTDGQGFGIGAQFHNVSKAQIYGVEISTNGVYNFNKNTKLFYNLGYVYTEPRDADYQERNAVEGLYTDPLQMKEKSNTGKYLKYRPKHSFKATVDFQWKRNNLGANVAWKSKILAVDYLMMDERPKTQLDLMDYVRGVAFGYSKGESLASYWKKHNTDYATVDMRLGVKATKEVAFQFMVNNLLNKEYSYRPMAVAAPRTFVVKMDITF